MVSGNDNSGFTTTYSYDDDGYLIKIQDVDDEDDEDDPYAITTNYVWDEGNIVAINVYDGSNLMYAASLQPLRRISNSSYNIDLASCLTESYVSVTSFNYTGNRQANLPLYIVSHSEGETVIITYRYETNLNGAISKVYCKPEGGDESLYMEISYK